MRRHLSFGLLAVPLAPAFALAGLPPVAVLLRAAEVTAIQEDFMRRAAAGTLEDVAIGRSTMVESVGLFLRNSRLAENLARAVEQELPEPERALGRARTQAAVAKLERISEVASAGEGGLSSSELTQMADLYRGAREEMRLLFELLPPAAQEEGRRQARAARAREREQLAGAQA